MEYIMEHLSHLRATIVLFSLNLIAGWRRIVNEAILGTIGVLTFFLGRRDHLRFMVSL